MTLLDQVTSNAAQAHQYDVNHVARSERELRAAAARLSSQERQVSPTDLSLLESLVHQHLSALRQAEGSAQVLRYLGRVRP